MLHCYDGKADCSNVLYIFFVRMSVYHVYDLSLNLSENVCISNIYFSNELIIKVIFLSIREKGRTLLEDFPIFLFNFILQKREAGDNIKLKRPFLLRKPNIYP